MLIVYHASTATLSATVTNADAEVVTGATVTVTIRDPAGTALASGQTMTEVGTTGVYNYVIASNLLPAVGAKYKATITATKDTNVRTATITLYTARDTD